jgi:hypothetical protein
MRHLISCATVIEELEPFLETDIKCHVLEFGLHADPARLRTTLQKEIDAVCDGETGDAIDPPTIPPTILLGYGSCGRGLVGLSGGRCRLVIPRVDDCIGLCLGSRDAHRKMSRDHPGTYWMTKGWMEATADEYNKVVAKYGDERADALYRVMFAAYKRLGVVDTGSYPLDEVRDYARQRAGQLGLEAEEFPGSTNLLHKLIRGPWSSEEFVICEPGQTTELSDFLE